MSQHHGRFTPNSCRSVATQSSAKRADIFAMVDEEQLASKDGLPSHPRIKPEDRRPAMSVLASPRDELHRVVVVAQVDIALA